MNLVAPFPVTHFSDQSDETKFCGPSLMKWAAAHKSLSLFNKTLVGKSAVLCTISTNVILMLLVSFCSILQLHILKKQNNLIFPGHINSLPQFLVSQCLMIAQPLSLMLPPLSHTHSLLLYTEIPHCNSQPWLQLLGKTEKLQYCVIMTVLNENSYAGIMKSWLQCSFILIPMVYIFFQFIAWTENPGGRENAFITAGVTII